MAMVDAGDAEETLKKLSLQDLDGDLEDEEDAGKKQKRGWFSSVGKGISKRGTRVGGIFSNSKQDEDLADKLARVKNCRSPAASASGGVANLDPESAKACRSVLSLMVRQMGKNLLKGGAVMNVSFPIQCCQPMTILEIAAKQAGLFHLYLPRANKAQDPLERMKNVVACFISGMALTSGNFLKPLNPLLGETLQVQYDDGSSAFLEQTCHHPPVSSFLLEGPQKLYRYYGYTTFEIGFGYNKMLLKNTGLRVLEFEDGGRIDIGFPADRWGNVFWGEMHHETLGEWDFTDEASGVRASIMFDADRKGSKIPSDSFVGFIERFSATDPDKDGTKVCTIEGSWVGYCDFDSQRYWDHAKLTRVPHASARSKLPSDSTNRADRNALEASDYKEAQAQKTALEEVQRAERKLRESGGGLGKKS
mmetsp:Transcript_66392/g.163608  ORF Transcript_66392/g.163608 Transcript_66392/m.163608 type:complete len:420 (+) Transcript_66392:186-1445(+)